MRKWTSISNPLLKLLNDRSQKSKTRKHFVWKQKKQIKKENKRKSEKLTNKGQEKIEIQSKKVKITNELERTIIGDWLVI